MPIEIGDLHLTRIHKIETQESANNIYHTVPGLNGNISQNIGRDSVRLVIEGIFYGPTLKDDLGKLRAIHTAHEPVDFVADITDQAYTGKVILDNFEVSEDAAEPEQFNYKLLVSEYVKPPKAAMGLDAMALDSINQAIKIDAAALMDIASLPDMLTMGAIPELSNPLEPLEGSLDPVKEAVGNLHGTIDGLTKLFGD